MLTGVFFLGQALSLLSTSLWDRLSWVPFILVGIGMLVWRARILRHLREGRGPDPLGFRSVEQEIMRRVPPISEGVFVAFTVIWLAVAIYGLISG
jgi:hypothetical protein